MYGTADIGSAYSPPDGVASSSTAGSSPQIESTVETVLDIGYREEVSLNLLSHEHATYPLSLF